MAKPKSKKIDLIKRDVFPRKAKEQSLINIEKLAVIMEVIEASTAVDDRLFLKGVNFQKKRLKLKKGNKTQFLNIKKNTIENEHPMYLHKSLQKREDDDIVLLNEASRYMKSKQPISLPNTGGLSHFMDLEERTDLLCNTPMADPLGPDSVDNVHWVEVKQELPEGIDICKITLTDLPLKCKDRRNEFVKITPSREESLTEKQDLQEMKKQLPEEILTDIDKWNDNSSFDDSSSDWPEIRNTDVLLKRKKKNHSQDCDICGKKLSSKGSLRLHKLKKHKQKVQFSCELCGLKFDFQREVVQHRNSDHRQKDGRFSCDECSRKFSHYHCFLTHIKSHENYFKEDESLDFVCKECDMKFESVESLRIHRAFTHMVTDNGLREKLKRHEKNFICHTCGKRFAFNCLLRDHINLHTGSKPYLCQKCGKSFSQKATLKQHAKTHNDIRPFQCSFCPVGFFYMGDLKKHERKHTGERPFICEVCGEGFSRSSHLVVHRRSHTGERPYTCDVCSRGFTKRGDVVRHRRIHTGEFPYLCQVCGKAFRQSTQCSNHIKSQHPDAPVNVARNPNPTHQRMQNQWYI